MPKFQYTAPEALNNVVARVRVKTESKELALEYLLYLARLTPTFHKNDYGRDASKNCTLTMSKERYADFADYRTDNSPVLETRKAFFVDALTRGASAYEAGYRLTDPRKPAESGLTVDRDWVELAGAIVAVLAWFSAAEGAPAEGDPADANAVAEIAHALAAVMTNLEGPEIGRRVLQEAATAFHTASDDGGRRSSSLALLRILGEATAGKANPLTRWIAPIEAARKRRAGA